MEKDFADKVMNRLGKYFHVEPEVWSKCGNYRIDYVLTNGNACFGVEFKDLDKKRGEDLGSHILQAMKYSISQFPNQGTFTRIPIFLCPPISYRYLILAEVMMTFEGREFYCDRHQKQHQHHTVNGMLGALNLGEIRTSDNHRNGQYIYFSFSNKPIWSEEKRSNGEMRGLHEKHHNFLLDKINKFSL